MRRVRGGAVHEVYEASKAMGACLASMLPAYMLAYRQDVNIEYSNG